MGAPFRHKLAALPHFLVKVFVPDPAPGSFCLQVFPPTPQYLFHLQLTTAVRGFLVLPVRASAPFLRATPFLRHPSSEKLSRMPFPFWVVFFFVLITTPRLSSARGLPFVLVPPGTLSAKGPCFWCFFNFLIPLFHSFSTTLASSCFNMPTPAEASSFAVQTWLV